MLIKKKKAFDSVLLLIAEMCALDAGGSAWVMQDVGGNTA